MAAMELRNLLSKSKWLAVELLCGAMLASVPAAGAQPLMGADFMTVPLHDFVSHFEFKERETHAGVGGLTEHTFLTSEGLELNLGVTPDRKVVHMRLVMPRDLIDNPAQTLAGRDIVMSFLAATMAGPADYPTLHPLIEEVEVRDLDLHPVTINATSFADSGKPIPKNAYKIGGGPLQKGDRITFIDKMPALAKTASTMYSAFIGRSAHAGISSVCSRLDFQNQKSAGAQSLVCESWDREFYDKNVASSQAGPSAADGQDGQSHISQALELLATKDPIQSRLAEKELEQAESSGSTDYRLPSLKALAAMQMGRQTKGLAALRDAIKKIPPGAKYESFSKEMTAAADDMEKKLAQRAPSPVPAEKRKYVIPPGTAAIIAEKDNQTGLVTMAISGGHDPDGGQQDGTDDGIIQVLWENINKPSEVLRTR